MKTIKKRNTVAAIIVTVAMIIMGIYALQEPLFTDVYKKSDIIFTTIMIIVIINILIIGSTLIEEHFKNKYEKDDTK